MAIPNTTTPDAAAEAERKRLEAEAAAKQNQSAASSPTPAGPTPDQYSIKPAFDLPKTDFEKSVDTLSAVKPATSPAPTPVQTPATAQTPAPATAQTSVQPAAAVSQPAPRVAGASQQTVGTVVNRDGTRTEQRDGGGTATFDKGGRLINRTEPVKSSAPAAPVAPVAIPDAVKATPAPAVLAPEKSMTNWGAATTGRAIGFKEAGFDSQEQYDAAKAGPQTQIKSPVNPAWQQKQDAATAQAAGERARLDRMGTHESGFALGNAMRADIVAAAQKSMANPSRYADAGASASAAAGQANLINRVNAQQTDANAYQENWRKQHAASAVKPALAEPVAPAQVAASPAAAAPVASAPAPSPVKPEPVAAAEVKPAATSFGDTYAGRNLPPSGSTNAKSDGTFDGMSNVQRANNDKVREASKSMPGLPILIDGESNTEKANRELGINPASAVTGLNNGFVKGALASLDKAAVKPAVKDARGEAMDRYLSQPGARPEYATYAIEKDPVYMKHVQEKRQAMKGKAVGAVKGAVSAIGGALDTASKVMSGNVERPKLKPSSPFKPVPYGVGPGRV